MTPQTDPSDLRILGAYSARMAAGDYDAVFDTFAPGFLSHVTARVSPGEAPRDIRPHERTWRASARAACSEGIGLGGARFDAA